MGRVGFWLQTGWESWGSQEMPENSILGQALPLLRKLSEALAAWASVLHPLTTRGFLPRSVRGCGWEEVLLGRCSL